MIDEVKSRKALALISMARDIYKEELNNPGKGVQKGDLKDIINSLNDAALTASVIMIPSDIKAAAANAALREFGMGDLSVSDD